MSSSAFCDFTILELEILRKVWKTVRADPGGCAGKGEVKSLGGDNSLKKSRKTGRTLRIAPSQWNNSLGMEVDLSGTVLPFQGTLGCTLAQKMCVGTYGWPRRKSPETLARHVGMEIIWNIWKSKAFQCGTDVRKGYRGQEEELWYINSKRMNGEQWSCSWMVWLNPFPRVSCEWHGSPVLPLPQSLLSRSWTSVFGTRESNGWRSSWGSPDPYKTTGHNRLHLRMLKRLPNILAKLFCL